MQKKTFFFAGIFLCLLIIAAVGFYWYQKPRAGVSSLQPAYTLRANELYAAYQQDEKKANQQFLEKVIEVEGMVENVQSTDNLVSVLLSSGNNMGGINCSIAKNENKAVPPKGTPVKIKGRCVGFLTDVNLVDAIIQP